MSKDDKTGFWGAFSIGVGGMVGGGIFALLGLAIGLARGGTPVAFAFAGGITLITAYSYARLSVAYPNKGGTVKFINQGWGATIFSGGLNNLLWLSYVIMLALYAKAFGSYGLALFPKADPIFSHVFLSGIIILATVLNYLNAKLIGEIETGVVVFKILILLIFVALGLATLGKSDQTGQLAVSEWTSPFRLLAGGMVIFVAYEGFELIANTADDIENPKRNLPAAYFASVGFVVLLYVLISIVSVGQVSFDKLAEAKDYALAEAAKPFFGAAGYTLVSITALLSTFSAINATLYGGSRVNYETAEEKELFQSFTNYIYDEPVGLPLIAILTLLVANLLPLESISTSGSAGFLLIFAAVNYVAYKKRADINANKYLPLTGTILCAIAFVVLLLQQGLENIWGAVAAVTIVGISFLIEWLYKRKRN
ncbi:MAG: APC family permease [Saprospiraceae bacterium]|nr:APC family permease [Lewinella sp.]